MPRTTSGGRCHNHLTLYVLSLAVVSFLVYRTLAPSPQGVAADGERTAVLQHLRQPGGREANRATDHGLTLDVPLTVFMERLRGARLLTIAHSLPPWSVSEPFAKRAPENREDIYDFQSCASIKYDLPDMDQRKDVRAVIGHQHYGAHKWFPGRTPVYLFVVRDNVDMLRSLYQYHSGGDIDAEKLRSLMLGGKNDADAHNSQLTVEACGPQLEVLCSVRDTLAAATAQLNLAAQDTIYANFVDRPHETLRLLAHKLNFPELASRNTTEKVMPLGKQYKVLEVTEDVRQEVRDANKWDVELFDFADAQMDRQLQCLG